MLGLGLGFTGVNIIILAKVRFTVPIMVLVRFLLGFWHQIGLGLGLG